MTSTPRLPFLGPNWFSLVMGLSGLALAWYRAASLLGNSALWVAEGLGVLAAGVMLVLLVTSVWRWLQHRPAWMEDLHHPVRHPFVAAMPIGLMLLATVWVQLRGPSAPVLGLWLLGSVLQVLVTVWVLSRWVRGEGLKGLGWAALTPAMFIPVVGNVVAPLGGVALGMPQWSAAQAAIGLMFWPVLLGLLMVRIGMVGMWPPRLLPTTFITIAPPAVGGLALLNLGAPPLLAWAAWGCAMFFAAWSATTLRPALKQPFGLAFWGMSFPLAALAALSLRLAGRSSAASVSAGQLALELVALATLALASVVIGWLLWSTVKGLLNGTLLVAEPAPGAPSATAATPAPAATPPSG